MQRSSENVEGTTICLVVSCIIQADTNEKTIAMWSQKINK